MPLYPFLCPNCNTQIELQMTIEKYEDWDSMGCPSLYCEHVIGKDDRIITASNVTRETYVMGTARPGFAEQKEILKLEKESYDLKPEDKKDIKKAINEIKIRGK